MRKLLALLLTASLLLATFCLAACNRNEEKPQETTTKKEDPTTPPAPPEPDMTPGSVDNPTYMTDDPLTVSVEAGKTYHIAVKNPGGQKIYIDSPNAKITYNGTVYDPVDGTLAVELIASSGDGRKAAVLGISTQDGNAATFEVRIEARLGSMGNPIVLESLDDLHVPVEKDQSIYYAWTATENGNFRVSCAHAKSNIILTTDNRTTGESNGTPSMAIGVEIGETVVISVGTIGTATIAEGLDLTFTFETADPTADFLYTVSVASLISGGIEGVTVEIYNHADDTLVTTLVTDENGYATYTGTWADCYAKITVPEGYTVIADNDEDPTNDNITDFHLKSGLFGGANAIFTLVMPELDEEEE